MKANRKHRKTMVGFVLSDKMDKTIVVRLERLSIHKQYKRIIKKASKFKVHDENNQAKVGDKVKITQTRPFSKEKKWRLVEIIK
ncbi:MAG: 30S ribosomal protein S17 [Candidatus Omnitrophica bacterium]|nr:30S ribosomal protein S17 [Candidatus Omnitrophota bacterium]